MRLLVKSRVLYEVTWRNIALVRSQFENCSIIWRPHTKSLLDKFEAVQKLAIKWILSEEHFSYSPYHVYLSKCKEINLLPMSYLFDLNQLLFFHKIVYDMTPVVMPSYLSHYNPGNSRLRSSHMDHLCFESSIDPRTLDNVQCILEELLLQDSLSVE